MDALESLKLVVQELQKKDDRTSLYRCTKCGEECLLIATEVPKLCVLSDYDEHIFDCKWEEIK